MEILRLLSDRESRSTRRIEAFLCRQDGHEIRALVTNISRRGCQLKPQELLAVDELVRIEFPRVGSVAAKIRWMSDERAGAEFIPDSDVWEEHFCGQRVANCQGSRRAEGRPVASYPQLRPMLPIWMNE